MDETELLRQQLSQSRQDKKKLIKERDWLAEQNAAMQERHEIEIAARDAKIEALESDWDHSHEALQDLRAQLAAAVKDAKELTQERDWLAQHVDERDDAWTKRRSEQDWQTMIAQVNDVTRQRDALIELLNEQSTTVPITNEPLLGLATTEQMFRELITRFVTNMYGEHTKMLDFDRALVLAEMLGGLSATEKEYREVDHG